jgi:hypothetical protein
LQVASIDASGRDFGRPVEAQNGVMKLLPRVLLLGVLSGFATAQANADDIAASKAASARKPAKAIKPAARTGDELGVKFSNPYAPPEGTAQPKDPEFPAAQSATPADPTGGVSFTAKWKATDGPIDPFWNIRNAPGQEAPGDSFLGGLKLGF